jgi:hypothetical protein
MYIYLEVLIDVHLSFFDHFLLPALEHLASETARFGHVGSKGMLILHTVAVFALRIRL